MPRAAAFLLCALLGRPWPGRHPLGLALAEEAADAPGEELPEIDLGEIDLGEENGGVDPEEAPRDPAAQAQELQEKLALLKKLVADKMDSATPELKEKLDGLVEQVNKLTEMSSLKQLGGEDMAGVGSSHDEQMATVCTMLSVKRAGMGQSSTTDILKQLAAQQLEPEQAAELDLVRMITTCIAGLDDSQLADFSTGKLQLLPKELADKAALPEAKAEALTLLGKKRGVFGQIATVARMLGEPDEEKPQAKPAKPAQPAKPSKKSAKSGPPPVAVSWGWLAAIPVVGAIIFMTKKFIDMQREHEKIKEKKAAKKGQKQK